MNKVNGTCIFGQKASKGDPREIRGADGRIILKWIFEKFGVNIRGLDLNLFGVGYSVGFL
jgi:hypothetical protein